MSDNFARPPAPWALRLVPPLPAIAQRILALVSNEEVNTQAVGDLVKLDPTFSAELLRLANSAIFSSRREVKSLSHAIVLVGMDHLKTMATLVALNRMVRGAVKIEALQKVWTHSLATAFIAQELAARFKVNRETAYTVGLLHNLGVLGLMSAYPEQYSCMLDVNREFGFDLIGTERDLFEIDHCLAGSYLAQDWDFPDEMAAAIALHHEDLVSGEVSLDNLIKVSWRLADNLGFGAFASDQLWEYDDLIAYIPDVKKTWLGKSTEEAQAELKQRLAAVMS